MRRHYSLAYWMAAIALHLTGCATQYEPKSGKEGYGYREIVINPDVYYLEFQGNVFTSLPTANKYWYWRADEICAPKGQVADEIVTDVSAPPLRRPTAGQQESDFIGFAFYLGEPLGSGYLHSKAGYFRCVDLPEAERRKR